MTAIDDYLERLPPPARAAFARVREVVAGVAPEAEEGTIRFTPEHPVPDDVLADLVRARRREISP